MHVTGMLQKSLPRARVDPSLSPNANRVGHILHPLSLRQDFDVGPLFLLVVVPGVEPAVVELRLSDRVERFHDLYVDILRAQSFAQHLQGIARRCGLSAPADDEERPTLVGILAEPARITQIAPPRLAVPVLALEDIREPRQAIQAQGLEQLQRRTRGRLKAGPFAFHRIGLQVERLLDDPARRH